MNDPRRTWTVLVVDDNTGFLEASSAWMDARPEFRPVGTAANGAEALERVAALQPDLVLMDAAMPVLDGFEATRLLRERGDRRRIVIVSFHDSAEVRREAWTAGADDFVAKAELTQKLPAIVRGFATGHSESEVRPRSVSSENRRAQRSPSKQEGT